MSKKFDSRTFGETQTAGGQTVHFSCGVRDREKVAAFLAEHVCDIDVPTTGRVSVPHGGFGRYTRYDITQHEYAGYGSGYIEVLEVKNPPNERGGFVIHDFRSDKGAVFSEWDSLADALNAYERFWTMSVRDHRSWQELSCKRFVPCGALTPWFYAVGNQELIGDYAFPEGLQDDPVYVFGQKFVVCLSKDDAPRVKTCLGTRFLSGDYKDSPYCGGPWHKRVVYWDDGSTLTIDSGDGSLHGGWARPLVGGEMWVTAALAKFQVLLSGKTDQFSLDFTDGMRFVGKLVPAKTPAALTKAGRYWAHLKIEGEDNAKGAFDFSPTEEFPDATALLSSKMAKKHPGKEIAILEIRPDTPKGRKWTGVLYDRSKSE
ncbi:MAG: hypothetical protein WA082_02685 [Candidatus Moraniibacteriota bacterium]